ncbi:MAG: CAP domain-containing protein [Gammaproteobacteria bacterium]
MQKIFIRILLCLGLTPLGSMAGTHSLSPIDTVDLELQIHQQINRERLNRGLTALNDDAQLVAIARNHSRDMASRHFFNHVNLQGEYPSARTKRQGWDKQKPIDSKTLATGVAENIFLARLYDKVYTTKRNGITLKKEYEWISSNQLVQTIVQGWIHSPHHRKVMFSSQYDRQGIGVFISGHDVYVTENLF